MNDHEAGPSRPRGGDDSGQGALPRGDDDLDDPDDDEDPEEYPLVLDKGDA